MHLIKSFLAQLEPLRHAFSRDRTYRWIQVCVVGMATRADLAGVSSLMCVFGFLSPCYEAMLRFFHSAAFFPTTLARLWTQSIMGVGHVMHDAKGRAIFAVDGIKVPKAGRKMPAVKKHHQSASNTKPEYIMGHSCVIREV